MTKICINCSAQVRSKNGEEVEILYDDHLFKKSKILKLLSCEFCGAICDKYLEYEGTLLLLDLALQNKGAYRHVLFNESYTATILKMTVLTIIVEGYCRWSTEQTGKQFFEQELQFYSNVGEAFTSLLIFMTVSCMIFVNCNKENFSLKRFLLGTLLAYCTKFLKLIALLWVNEDSSFLWSFVDFLFLLTSANVVQVMTHRYKLVCLLAMSLVCLLMQLNDSSSYILQRSLLCS